jgi:hypothetical protein
MLKSYKQGELKVTSHILTKEVAQKAVWLAKIAFLAALEAEQPLVNGPNIHIVIVDPTIPYSPDAIFEDAILYEESVGTPSPELIGIARSKAQISWRYGMNSQVVRELYPQLYTKGMVIYPGGVFLHEIAGGASGVQSQWDQWFTEIVISTCRAMCVTEMRQLIGNGTIFIGDVKK